MEEVESYVYSLKHPPPSHYKANRNMMQSREIHDKKFRFLSIFVWSCCRIDIKIEDIKGNIEGI